MRIALFLSLVLSASFTFAAEKPAIDPKSATLAEALTDWINLIEAKDLKTLTTRWAASDASIKSITDYWEQTQKAHAEFNYKTWLTEKSPSGDPAKIGDKTQFKVGGHSYRHIHINWEKTATGWRIESVAMCR